MGFISGASNKRHERRAAMEPGDPSGHLYDHGSAALKRGDEEQKTTKIPSAFGVGDSALSSTLGAGMMNCNEDLCSSRLVT
jgi:hypothetical protein